LPAYGGLAYGSTKFALVPVLHLAVGVEDDGDCYAQVQSLVQAGLVLVHQSLFVLNTIAMPLIA
jgi:hypothetical protein